VTTGPLEGVRVLDLGIIYAGPYAGLHLADFGADVVKIESPEGDPWRSSGAVVPENGKAFQYLNRGRRSVAINLARPKGRSVVHEMVKEADVVVINARPGVPQRLGVDYETLSNLNAALIYADITGFSPGGPWSGEAATNVVGEAYGGAVALGGKLTPAGAPINTGVTLADLSSGLALALGICAALYERTRTGQGQRVSTSLVRSVMSFSGMFNMREPITDAVLLAPVLEQVREARERGGSYAEVLGARQKRGLDNDSSRSASPYYGGFSARGGALVLGALTPNTRAAAREVLAIESDPMLDPDFDPLSPAGRTAMRELRERVEQVFTTRTVEEWVAAFRARGVPVSPVNLPEDLAEDPQGLVEMVDVNHAEFGIQRHVKPIIDFSRTPAQIRRGSPTLGAHTTEVLTELGLSQEQIQELRDGGDILG